MAGSLSDKLFSRLVTRGRLEVTYADGSKSSYGTPEEGFPEVAIRLTDKRVVRDIVLDPGLGAAEAFMDGRLVIERGDIMDLVSLARANHRFEHGGRVDPPSFLRRVRGRIEFLHRAFNNSTSSRRNVAHHYDIGNDLYRLMLDKDHMQYSCAYWPEEDMTLEQAQDAKLAHIAAKLALKPGQTVLDIGCGWGGMAIFLAYLVPPSVLFIPLATMVFVVRPPLETPSGRLLGVVHIQRALREPPSALPSALASLPPGSFVLVVTWGRDDGDGRQCSSAAEHIFKVVGRTPGRNVTEVAPA